MPVPQAWGCGWTLILGPVDASPRRLMHGPTGASHLVVGWPLVQHGGRGPEPDLTWLLLDAADGEHMAGLTK